MVDGQPGTIVELDVHDAMGWIELDEGGRVRFGGSALAGFVTEPGPGTRVRVVGTAPGYKGVTKAVRVVPADPPAPAIARTQIAVVRRRIAWPDLVRDHPRWSDAEEACLPFPDAIPPLALTEHPLWSPWIEELARSPVIVGLRVPDALNQQPIDPSPADSFAHGQVAFLDAATWPSCGRCEAPLEFCVQLAPPLLAQWGLGERGLVALICFECAFAHGGDQRIGHVAFTSARVCVETAVPSRAAAYMPRAQLVTASAPRRMPAMSTWHLHRSTVRPDTAAAMLLGNHAVELSGPFPADLDPDDLYGITGEMTNEVFDDWVDGNLPPGEWGGAVMGGVPHWDQRDRTPHCSAAAHGEMRQLLEYNGGQFLDGGIHVFLCREAGCDRLAFVAEF